MKKTILLTFVLVGLFIFSGCCSTNYKSYRAGSEELSAGTDVFTITGADSGTAIELAIGAKLVLKLDANPSTGYSWRIEDLDEKILHLTGKDYQQNEAPAGMVGVPGVETFNFNAVKKGSTILALIYNRGKKGDIAEDFQAVVNVK